MNFATFVALPERLVSETFPHVAEYSPVRFRPFAAALPFVSRFVPMRRKTGNEL